MIKAIRFTCALSSELQTYAKDIKQAHQPDATGVNPCGSHPVLRATPIP
ncbi:MAG: hypothetical protein Q9N62_01795 [Ghiorsea sp.]|nr:hypothetical protein [Ghiorsea sp.]